MKSREATRFPAFPVFMAGGMRVILENAVIRRIMECYDMLTSVEKSIADFFIKNRDKGEFSSRTIANRLYVSEASLSRFAKKCGYKGFREFIFAYERTLLESGDGLSGCAGRVLEVYEELLAKSRELLDEDQLKRVVQMLSECRCVRVYGKGSSGYAAQEFSVRFMRMGMDIEAVTDTHIMKMSSALSDSGTLVIAVTLSGTTKEVLTAVRYAKKNGARVILMTANRSGELDVLCDEVIYIAGLKNLEEGMMISPQFPVQVMTDILFSYFFQKDGGSSLETFHETLDALQDRI